VLGAVTLFGGLRLGVGLGLLLSQHQAALETSDVQRCRMPSLLSSS
jgi:hypothetical protein